MAFQKIKGVPGPNGDTCNSAQPCPGIWQEDGDSDNVLVQGYIVDAATSAEIGVPEGELIVRVPRTLLGGAV